MNHADRPSDDQPHNNSDSRGDSRGEPRSEQGRLSFEAAAVAGDRAFAVRRIAD